MVNLCQQKRDQLVEALVGAGSWEESLLLKGELTGLDSIMNSVEDLAEQYDPGDNA